MAMATTSSAASGKEVIRNIQVLRGLSALLVIFVHLDSLLRWLNVRPFGGGGVEVFFVISGFIMVYTTMDSGVTARSFLKDRFARVIPLYWAVTLAVFSLALFAPRLLQATDANWIELLKSLAFIPFQKSNGGVEPILFVGWSLNYEIFFYLVFSLGLAFKSRILGIASACAFLIILVAVGVCIRPGNVVLSFYCSPASLDFVLGVVIGLAYRKLPIQGSLILKASTALIMFLSLWPLILLPLAAPHMSPFLLCGVPAGILVGGCLLLERWGWTIRSTLLLRIGTASYSIYLIHPFVTQSFQKSAALIHPGVLAALLILIATLMATSASGVMMHHWVERPLSRAVRNLLKARRLNPRAP